MAKKKKSVLIIEDEPAQIHALEKTLLKGGVIVHTASNGHEGFEKAKAETPDIILLDIIMPVMDGIATLEKINSDTDTKHIPVIVLTNFALYEKVQPFMNPDKDYFFTKISTSLKDIIAKVNAIGLTQLDEVRGASEKRPSYIFQYGEEASERSNEEIRRLRKSNPILS